MFMRYSSGRLDFNALLFSVSRERTSFELGFGHISVAASWDDRGGATIDVTFS